MEQVITLPQSMTVSVDDCLCHIFVEIINGDTFVFTLGHCALL